MAHDPRALPDEVSAFLAERHLATLTTLRPDGAPHVVAVGFTWDPEAGLVRVITNGTSRKAAHVRAGSPRAVVGQGDGRRWLAVGAGAARVRAICPPAVGGEWRGRRGLSMEGVPTVSDEPSRVAEAVRRYALRY